MILVVSKDFFYIRGCSKTSDIFYYITLAIATKCCLRGQPRASGERGDAPSHPLKRFDFSSSCLKQSSTSKPLQ